MRIDGANTNETFTFAVKDIDVEDKDGEHGDHSEGVNLIKGWTWNKKDIKILTNSYLKYWEKTNDEKYLRITGSQGGLENDAQYRAGFSVIADAKNGIEFQWTAGKRAGMKICDCGQTKDALDSLVHYRDVDTKAEIRTANTIAAGARANKVDINNYIYDGVSLNSDNDPSKRSASTTTYMNEPNNGRQNIITFWYKKIPTKTTITVYYRDKDNPSGTIADIESIKDITADKTVTNNHATITNYTNLNKYSVDSSDFSKATTGSSYKVTYDGKNHTVTFWYEKAAPTEKKVNVLYRDWNNGTPLYISGISDETGITVKGNTDFYPNSSKDSDIIAKGYEFLGSKTNKETSKVDGRTKVTVTLTDGITQIIYYYQKAPKIKVKVISVDDSTKTIIKQGSVTEHSKPISNTKINQLALVDNYNALNTYRIIKGTHTYNKEDSNAKGAQAVLNVTGNEQVKNNQVLVVFYYQIAKKEVSVLYRELKNNTPYVISGISDENNISINTDRTFKPNTTTDSTIKGKGYEFMGSSTDVNKTIVSGRTDVPVMLTDNIKQVVYYYQKAPNIKVKVISVDNTSKTIIKTGSITEYSKPIDNTKINQLDLVKNYKALNTYRIIKGTHLYNKEESNATGSQAILNVTGTEQVKNNQVLVVFYYESNFKATVNHVYINPITKESKDLKTESIQIVPGTNKTISSGKFEDYINLRYEVTPNISVTNNNFKEYGDTTYDITFTPGESNYEITFYYTSQIIEIRHEYPDGTPAGETVTKILDPDTPEQPLPDKEVDHYTLDGGSKNTPPSDGVLVPIKPGQSKRVLIFVYKRPGLVFGPDEPENQDPDPDYDEHRKKYKTGITPNDMKNQLIGQDTNAYYWVLDEKTGEITVRFAYRHFENGTSSANANVKIPFNVYVGDKLYNANESIPVTLAKSSLSDSEFDVFEGKVSNIHIPLTTEEKEYTITGTVNYTYVDGDNTTNITGYANAKVTVVGAIYDFSITNIDGSSTTGDSIWKTSLFPSVKEYEANTAPIGQGIDGQKNAKYNYGIKTGTRFYFSINTKGAKNSTIAITPKFYYYDATGAYKGEVTIKDANGAELNVTRKASLTDANRTTAEYQKELAKGRTLYSGAYSNPTPEIGNYAGVNLGTGLRMPYVTYGADSRYHENSSVTNNDNNLKNVSHWYGDFLIPNNATYYLGSTKINPKTGYIVVGFSIKSKAGNSDYLAYNLESPFTTASQSEWKYERGNIDNNITLPNANKTVSDVIWNNLFTTDNLKPAGFAPVMIYQISQTTSQNIDSTGTH